MLLLSICLKEKTLLSLRIVWPEFGEPVLTAISNSSERNEAILPLASEPNWPPIITVTFFLFFTVLH